METAGPRGPRALPGCLVGILRVAGLMWRSDLVDDGGCWHASVRWHQGPGKDIDIKQNVPEAVCDVFQAVSRRMSVIND